MYKIEASISTSSWVGCGRDVKYNFTGETLEQALDKLYTKCRYLNNDGINYLSIYYKSNYSYTTGQYVAEPVPTFYFEFENYDGGGTVNVIRYIDNTSNTNCIIFEDRNYIGSKCKAAVNAYKDKLDQLKKQNSVRGDF